MEDFGTSLNLTLWKFLSQKSTEKHNMLWGKNFKSSWRQESEDINVKQSEDIKENIYLKISAM